MKIKYILKEITPPIIIKIYRKLFLKKINSNKELETQIKETKLAKVEVKKGEEKDSDWYNNFYENETKDSIYNVHYTKSPYYYLWSVVIEKLNLYKPKSILELGCGNGQLSSLIYDKGFKNYLGVDFSKVAIEKAKKNCPTFSFICENIVKTDLIEKYDYDLIIILETLEHIKGDIEVLKKIKSGTHLIAMVPNFDSDSHVRFFLSKEHVKKRYDLFFEKSPRITEWRSDLKNNKRYFLIEGIIK